MSRRLKAPKKQGLANQIKTVSNRSKTFILENDQGLEPGTLLWKSIPSTPEAPMLSEEAQIVTCFTTSSLLSRELF